MLFGKKAATIGLDIGSHQIKVVEIQKGGKGLSLVNYGIAPLLPEAIVEGEIMDRGLVVDTIKTLFETRKIKGNEVVSAVSGRGVIVKRIPMDKMKEQEARERIKWEAEQHIPFDIADVVLDFQILNPDTGNNQMEVSLVAAKNETVNGHLDLLSGAGLNPAILDYGAFAVQNAFELNYSPAPDEIVALVHIGADITNINFVKGTVPFFTRDLPVAGNACLQLIQKNLGLSYDQAAELIKGEAVPDVTAESSAEVFGNFAGDFASQIERTLSFLAMSGGGEKMNRMYLSGGGALIPSLQAQLADKFQIPVELFNPLQKITYDPNLFGAAGPDKVAPMLTLAIGLGVREVK
ncbi:MAG: type IV pilus assembly protein PilM [Rhodocyclaceae bacterium]|nr:type IV pilus assembly protein PilM [Rhodocyclaceae bacterium]